VPDTVKEQMKRPLLVIAAGTGIAAANFAAHSRHHWQKKGAQVGEVKMILGARDRKEDQILIDDCARFTSSIHIAPSRTNGTPKTYVQHLLAGETSFDTAGSLSAQGLKKESDDLKLWVKQNPNVAFLVCGDQKMGEAVHKVLVDQYGANEKSIFQSTSTTRYHDAPCYHEARGDHPTPTV
jgi:sulfite reductase alpha subunit-like flavoprotein